MELKQCGKCGITKSADDFYRDRTRKDGREWICKACKEAYKRALREKKKKGYLTEKTSMKLEQIELKAALDLPEEFRCSFCGEIKKEVEMVWYDKDAPLSYDAINVCKECYERKD
jgi:hypothetical protein